VRRKGCPKSADCGAVIFFLEDDNVSGQNQRQDTGLGGCHIRWSKAAPLFPAQGALWSEAVDQLSWSWKGTKVGNLQIIILSF